jgi:gliding motility-associated-like protein
MSRFSNPLLFILGLLAFVFLPNLAQATHVAGGEIRYRCLGNDSVEISLIMVRDCDGVELNPTVQFQIYKADGTVYLLIETAIDSTYFENPVVVLDNCNIPVESACRQLGVYKHTVYMPPTLGGYGVFVEICCRNDELDNIDWDDPVSGDAVFYTHVPQDSGNLSLICNNSVQSDLITMIQICQNQPMTVDFNAFDIDGDSLSFELCNPNSQLLDDTLLPFPSFELMPFLEPEYSFENMLGSGSALAIDAVTGIITATPTDLGLFGTGYCLHEWRDGEIISTTIKEFQIEVVLCVPLVATIGVNPNLCSSGLTPIGPLANQTGWDVEWIIFDQTGAPIYTTNIEFFEYEFPSDGNYTISMTQFPGTPCEATVTLDIVYTQVSDMGELSFPEMGCVAGGGQQQILFPTATINNPDIGSWSVTAYGPDGQFFNWTTGTQAFVPVETGGWIYVLTANYINSCVIVKKDTLFYSFDDLPEAEIENDPVLCNTTLVEFVANDNNGWVFNWTILNSSGATLITSGLPNFVYQFPGSGFYTVNLVVNSSFNSCVDSTSMDYQVVVLSGSDVPLLGPAPCVDGIQQQIIIVPDSLINEYGLDNWTWTTIPPSGPQLVYSSMDTTIIPITVDGNWGFIFTGDIGGCSIEGFQFETYNPISAIPPPTIPTCVTDTVYLLPNWQLDGTENTYLWGPANLVSSTTEPNPFVVSSQVGSQPLSYTITNPNGCSVSGQVQLVEAQYELLITPVEVGCSLPITEVISGNGVVTDIIWSNDPAFGSAFWFGSTFVIDETLLFPIYVQANINGCQTQATLTEPVFNLFEASLAYELPPCDYLTTSALVTANISADAGDFTIDWQPVADSTINEFTTIYNLGAAATLITATVTAEDGCTQVATVTLPELPTVSWSVDASTTTPEIELGQSGQLDAAIIGNPSVAVDYTWTPAAELATATSASTAITPTQVGTWVYTVAASYPGTDCILSDTISITVVDNNYCIPPYVLLPNSFSPNADNLNDVFHFADAQYIATCTVEIYDRWGELVFGSNDPAFAWDGKLNDLDLPADLYNALIEIVCVDGEKRTMQTQVYLVR